MTIDTAKLMDEGRWTGYQKFLVACTALTIIFDGLDNTLLPTAIPTLMDEWHLPRDAFSTALAMGPLGMLIGGIFGGWLGDRMGRRTALLGSLIAFALPSAAVFFANNVTMLELFRFLAGLGLGGAMPNATALACEYVPRRHRPFAVTLAIVCIPVGATLAASLAKLMIPAFGWRYFFLVCGLVPLVLAGVLLVVLAESPHYLTNHRKRWPELIVLLRRFGHTVPADTEFTEAHSGRHGKTASSLFDVFKPAYFRDTVALFFSFFFSLLTVYLGLQLLVTVLKGAGFQPDEANGVFTWFNIGGVIGALIGAKVIQQLGSKTPMLVLCAIAILGSFGTAAMHVSPESKLMVIAMCTLLGITINAVQVAMYALAAHVYPTEIRGRGVGTVVAVGRVGNILAAYVGNFALNHGGVPAYFKTYGIGMIVVFISLAVVRNHIQRHKPEIREEMVDAVAD